MKNKLTSILLCATLSVSMILNTVTPVVAKPSDDSVKQENIDSSEEGAEEKVIQNENAEGEASYMTTGTQLNAMDLEENVDADIEEEIEALIPVEQETVIISSIDDLKRLAKKCKLDTWSANKNVYLEKDILLTGSDFVTIPYFAGTFDGQGHTISGYVVDDEQSNIALFSYVSEGAIISNLNVVADVIPSGKSSVVGGIVAHNSGVIRNCSIKGVVAGTDYIGGIAGINELKGIIADCTMSGFVSGEHETGGIAGENMGNILRCTNNASVNTEEKDASKSLDDINIDYYVNLFSIGNNADKDTDKESMANGIVDTGGIAGLSIGVIQHCTNNGKVGYERLGYNVGGITGRQSGYINDCTNTSTILGRKDVGGIAGQAEPYVTIDFSQDIVRQLSDNISKLHDIIAVTLDDADAQSDTISNRLSIIQSFTNSALDDTGYLADNTVSFVDGVMDEANKAASRADFIMDEMAKDGGVLDQMTYAADNMTATSEALIDTIEDFSIKQYLSSEEQKRLDSDIKNSKDAVKLYDALMSESTNAFTQYYRDKLRSKDTYWTDGYTDEKTGKTYTEQNMFPTINGVLNKGWPKWDDTDKGSWSDEKIIAEYKSLDAWKHVDGSNATEYPADSSTPQGVLDKKLEDQLKKEYGAVISIKAAEYADAKFKEVFGTAPKDYLSVTLLDATELIYSAVDEMGDQVPEDADRVLDNIDRLTNNLKSAFRQTKDTFRTVGDMDAIELPKLGEEYRAHCTSLNNSLQGMSDNFGYLNTEMNNGSHEMIDDLSAVNDQFNVIMELYADAIDGVLDRDYSNIIEDDSRTVANECVDGTIADCINYGDVEASLDAAGVAGTMAIEYDYDLESDVTGIKDSNMNTTYLTKCVLRQNINRGKIKTQKDYVGGVSGLQELGIILRCENYAKIESTDGKYIGGIAGSSLSDIYNSYEKSLVIGEAYVGGIVGRGANITECYAIPTIEDALEYKGAIAGYVVSSGVVRDNYFVNDDLAGIDRVSYSRKAEPLEYSQLVAQPDIPSDFKNMKISYLLIDEDDNGEEVSRTLAVNTYKYGSHVTLDMFPTVPFKEGFYTKWEIEDVDELLTDIEIDASYIRVISTLASDELLSNGQSQILVDGQFKEGDVFSTINRVSANDKLDKAIEYWELTIPDDGKLVRKVRYHLPDDVSDTIGDDFSVYVLENGKWVLAACDKMGKYTTFDVGGSNPKFQIVDNHRELPIKWIIAGGSAIAVILVIIIINLIVKGRRKKIRSN